MINFEDKDARLQAQEMTIETLRRKLAEAQRDVANLRRIHQGAQNCIRALNREIERLKSSDAERVFRNG